MYWILAWALLAGLGLVLACVVSLAAVRRLELVERGVARSTRALLDRMAWETPPIVQRTPTGALWGGWGRYRGGRQCQDGAGFFVGGSVSAGITGRRASQDLRSRSDMAAMLAAHVALCSTLCFAMNCSSVSVCLEAGNVQERGG